VGQQAAGLGLLGVAHPAGAGGGEHGEGPRGWGVWGGFGVLVAACRVGGAGGGGVVLHLVACWGGERAAFGVDRLQVEVS